GLVGAWGFEEASGSAVSDSSSQGNNGSLSNATRTTAGPFSSAVQFNGTTSEVIVPDASSLDLAPGMTLEAWLSPPGTQSSWRSALAKEQTGGLSYGLYANTNNNRPSANIHTNVED